MLNKKLFMSALVLMSLSQNIMADTGQEEQNAIAVQIVSVSSLEKENTVMTAPISVAPELKTSEVKSSETKTEKITFGARMQSIAGKVGEAFLAYEVHNGLKKIGTHFVSQAFQDKPFSDMLTKATMIGIDPVLQNISVPIANSLGRGMLTLSEKSLELGQELYAKPENAHWILGKALGAVALTSVDTLLQATARYYGANFVNQGISHGIFLGANLLCGPAIAIPARITTNVLLNRFHVGAEISSYVAKDGIQSFTKAYHVVAPYGQSAIKAATPYGVAALETLKNTGNTTVSFVSKSLSTQVSALSSAASSAYVGLVGMLPRIW
jgi:hypothetical protein